MEEKQTPYQYMLFIFGDFKDKDNIVEIIATQVSSFTDENSYLKFNYGDYGVVMNFQSNLSFYDIRDHIHVSLEKVVPQYFLIEKPKHMYAFMPPELKLNLFDLNEENEVIDQKDINIGDTFKDTTNILDNFFFNIASTINPEDMLSDNDMKGMFENIIKKVEEDSPTIDELLEKIKDKGITSLSTEEKRILDEYSKT